MSTNEQSMYELMGGADTISRIVESFYNKVQADPLIGPLFPPDITPVMEKQVMFLSQFFGGPPLYTQQYGHPMMRKRHLPFEITQEKATAWLACMSRALQDVGIDESLQKMIIGRLSGPAYFFVNS